MVTLHNPFMNFTFPAAQHFFDIECSEYKDLRSLCPFIVVVLAVSDYSKRLDNKRM